MLIFDQLQAWISVNLWHLPEWYTRQEMAREIGCTKSPSLINALNTCVVAGQLESQRSIDDHNRPIIKYRIDTEYRESVFEELQLNASR